MHTYDGKGLCITHWNEMCWKCIDQLLTEPNKVIIASSNNILSFIKLSTRGLKMKNRIFSDCTSSLKDQQNLTNYHIVLWQSPYIWIIKQLYFITLVVIRNVMYVSRVSRCFCGLSTFTWRSRVSKPNSDISWSGRVEKLSIDGEATWNLKMNVKNSNHAVKCESYIATSIPW